LRADRAPPLQGAKAAGTLSCYADGFAGFRCDFVTGDVSTRDYFHPSTSGQATIAAGTWNVGPASPFCEHGVDPVRWTP